MSPEERDRRMMQIALDQAAKCPPSESAYSVGSVIVDRHGDVVTKGYSRETKSYVHAEEVALARALYRKADLEGATIYATMEPCGRRLSGRKPCAVRILEAGIRRVVYALGEPPVFVEATGADNLKEEGLTLIHLPEFAEQAREPNKHLLAGF